jgi:hypothetical protein
MLCLALFLSFKFKEVAFDSVDREKRRSGGKSFNNSGLGSKAIAVALSSNNKLPDWKKDLMAFITSCPLKEKKEH